MGDWLEPLDGPVDSDLGWTQEPSRTRSGGQVRGAHLGAGCGDGLPDLHRRDDPRPGSCHHSGGWEASGSGLSSRRCSVPAAAPRALGRPGRPALLLALPALSRIWHFSLRWRLFGLHRSLVILGSQLLEILSPVRLWSCRPPSPVLSLQEAPLGPNHSMCLPGLDCPGPTSISSRRRFRRKGLGLIPTCMLLAWTRVKHR